MVSLYRLWTYSTDSKGPTTILDLDTFWPKCLAPLFLGRWPTMERIVILNQSPPQFKKVGVDRHSITPLKRHALNGWQYLRPILMMSMDVQYWRRVSGILTQTNLLNISNEYFQFILAYFYNLPKLPKFYSLYCCLQLHVWTFFTLQAWCDCKCSSIELGNCAILWQEFQLLQIDYR